MFDKFFKLTERGSSYKKEFAAGITTFLTMAYIIIVNPMILSEAGMDKGALITATILASFFASVLCGVWGRVPYAMAPGMGLNAFFTYTLVIGKEISWQTALGVVMLSGIFFFLLTIFGIRKKVVNAIPKSIRLSVSAGIGLFIAFIGLQNMGLIVDNSATLVALGEFTKPVVFGIIGLVIIAVLEIRKIKGAILIGIVFTMFIGVFYGEAKLPEKLLSLPPSIMPIAFKFDLMGALKWSLFGSIFSLMFFDLFDSVGTIVACSHQAGLVEKDGSIPDVDKVLGVDAVATVAGAALGTSTTTAYIESGSGIAAGGRTGITAIVTGCFFLVALFFTDFIKMVPAFATAPALVIVGIHMFKIVREIDFKNLEVAIPAFLTIVIMPLTYSISKGLVFGFISYIVITVAAGDIKKIDPVMWIIGALSTAELIISAG